MELPGTKEELMRTLAEAMKKHGIHDWVIAFNDPDSDSQPMHFHGSLPWIHGMGRLINRAAGKQMDDNVFRGG